MNIQKKAKCTCKPATAMVKLKSYLNNQILLGFHVIFNVIEFHWMEVILKRGQSFDTHQDQYVDSFSIFG